MWLLTHTTTHEKRYLLAEKEKYSVGRVQADIPLTDDNSISRMHAVIYVSADSVKIEDPGSKYGVYLNANDIAGNQALTKNEPVAMRAGDIVRIGRLQNIWRLEKIVINCCTSTVEEHQLPELVQLLHIVNGNVQRTWDESCTHLVMPNVTVTIKVLQALLQGVPIVMPAFWTAYVECARQNHQQLPDVNDFVPEINEPFLRSNPQLLHVDLRRQRLFQGKKFIFMTERHMKSFEMIIKMAHGECDFVANDRHFAKKDMLKKEIIPVQCKNIGESQTQDVNNVISYIERNGRRAISDTELSLAILHCSTERYCNPDFKMQKVFEVETVDLTEKNGKVIVEDTPEPHAHESNRASVIDIVLPESVDLTEDVESNHRIDSSVVYSEGADAANIEMAEPDHQFAQPSTSGMHLGKRCRRRLSSDDEPTVEQNAEKRSKSNDAEPVEAVPPEADRTSITDSSQSSNLSGFLTTQNRFKKPNTDVPEQVTEQQSQQTQIDAAERRKRAIAALQSLSDDDDNNNDPDDNPFKFAGKRPAKRPKTNRMQAFLSANADDDDDDNDGGGFNFSTRSTQRNRGRASQQKSSENESSAGETSVLVPFNRSTAEITNRMSYIQPIKATTDGWLSRAFKKDVSIGNGAEESVALPGRIKIKEEKLEEWEMTEEEKKRKWLKSLANAIEVKTFDVTITRRSDCGVADETDGNVSAINGTIRNFKKFVKKRNYIAQTNVVRTNPVNITINPYARI